MEGERGGGEAGGGGHVRGAAQQHAAVRRLRQGAPPARPPFASPVAIPSCIMPASLLPAFLKGVGCIERVATVALPFPQRPQTRSGAKLAGRRRVTPSIKPTKACIGDVWGGGSSSRRRRRWS